MKVCIRTGARPGSEFAKVTAAHVTDHGERMEWTFKASEAKNNKTRIIRINDPDILKIVRRQMKLNPTGPIFRNSEGNPWTAESLKDYFDMVRTRLEKKGTPLDAGAVMYSCRHTYAKRTLQGYWTGKKTNLETLCHLMGNSRDVCWKHYSKWCDTYTDPLWDAC